MKPFKLFGFLFVALKKGESAIITSDFTEKEVQEAMENYEGVRAGTHHYSKNPVRVKKSA